MTEEKKSLLEIAKGAKVERTKSKIVEGEHELAVAWVNGDIGSKQLTEAYKAAGIGYSDGAAPSRVAQAIRDGVERGLIRVVLK